MRFDIITIFPEIFNSFQSEALIARAIKKKIIQITPHNLRKSPPPSVPPHRRGRKGGGARVILFSAKGKKFNQSMARTWAKKYGQLILICGRYEGIDERVAEYIPS